VNVVSLGTGYDTMSMKQHETGQARTEDRINNQRVFQRRKTKTRLSTPHTHTPPLYLPFSAPVYPNPTHHSRERLHQLRAREEVGALQVFRHGEGVADAELGNSVVAPGVHLPLRAHRIFFSHRRKNKQKKTVELAKKAIRKHP